MTRVFGCKCLAARVFVFWAVAVMSAVCQQVPAEILKGLSSDKFADRESAHAQLNEWARGKPAASVPALRKQVAVDEDPEIQVRCLSVLRELVIEKEFPGEGYLGISMFEMTVQVPGDQVPRRVIRIGMVLPGSAAEHAGLMANDLVIGLDDTIWRQDGMSTEFAKRIRDTRPGSEVTLVVQQGEKVSKLKVKVGLKPEEPGEEGAAAAQAARDRFFEKWLNKEDAVRR